MKKHIAYRIILLGLTATALLASFCLQGCGPTSEESGFVLGPSPVVSPDELANGSATSQPSEDQEEFYGEVQSVTPDPTEACEINRTADLIFLSYSVHYYEVYVNGKDRGVLPPKGNMRITVPEGKAQWFVVQKGKGKPPSPNYLVTKRCNSYKIPVGLDPRQREMEHAEQ